jgi:hypothetical protein
LACFCSKINGTFLERLKDARRWTNATHILAQCTEMPQAQRLETDTLWSSEPSHQVESSIMLTLKLQGTWKKDIEIHGRVGMHAVQHVWKNSFWLISQMQKQNHLSGLCVKSDTKHSVCRFNSHLTQCKKALSKALSPHKLWAKNAGLI